MEKYSAESVMLCWFMTIAVFLMAGFFGAIIKPEIIMIVWFVICIVYSVMSVVSYFFGRRA